MLFFLKNLKKISLTLFFLGLFALALCRSRADSMAYESLWPERQTVSLRSWYESGNGSVIVAYIGRQDWDDLLPWLELWQVQQEVYAVFLIDYGEESGLLWDKLPLRKDLSKCYGLKRFDSSVFRVLPAGHLPALYQIEPRSFAQGPFHYYDELLDSE